MAKMRARRAPFTDHREGRLKRQVRRAFLLFDKAARCVTRKIRKIATRTINRTTGGVSLNPSSSSRSITTVTIHLSFGAEPPLDCDL
jgi:hypothetical protein